MQAPTKPAPIPFGKLPRDYRTNMGPALARCYEEYGPLFRVQGISGEHFFLVGPEANRMVLLTHRHAFSVAAGWGRVFGPLELFNGGLGLMDGPVHAEHRRMITPAFTVARMDRYLPVMQRLVRERVGGWAAQGVVDVYEEVRKLIFAIAAETLVSLAPAEVEEFGNLYAQLLGLHTVTISASGTDWHQRRDFLRNRLNDLLQPKIAERRARPVDDVLGMLVAARDRQGGALNDEQLIGHINGLLIAGHVSSSSLTAWLLYLLSHHPAYAARVRAEQDEILGGRDEPTLDDLQRMEVLGNALSETERLYPPAASGARGVLTDVPFGNYVIPAGASVLYSIIGSHYLPSVWTEPERFDPDRFAPPREEDRRTPFALVSFGGGPRLCLGIHFAKTELKVLATHLLRRYDLASVPGPVPQPRYELTTLHAYGIKLRLIPRA